MRYNFTQDSPDTSTTSRTTTSYELSCWLSPQSRMDRDIAFFQRPRMTEVRIPVSRLHKARFLFGKGAVLDGKLTSSSCCTCTYLQLFNAIPRPAKKACENKYLRPSIPKTKGKGDIKSLEKGRNMRQLHSFTPLRASEKAKIDAPLQPQGRVDTTPRGVHIHFR